MKRRGFTLVELLVVIAIIAILAAMVVPVMLQAKEASRMRVCASNMRQLGSSIMRYIDDNDGYGLPKPAPGYDNPWVLCIEPLLPNYLPYTKASLQKELPPYTVSTRKISQPTRIWICSGDINRGNADTPYWKRFGSSYMYPGTAAYMTGDGPYYPAKQPCKPLTWKNPRRDMLLADYWFDFHSGNKVQHDFNDSIFPRAFLINKSQMRGINVMFLDMHLSTVSMAQRVEYQNYVIYDDNPGGKKKPMM